MSRAQMGEGSANQKIGSKAALSFLAIVFPIATARMSVSAQILQTHDLGYQPWPVLCGVSIEAVFGT